MAGPYLFFYPPLNADLVVAFSLRVFRWSHFTNKHHRPSCFATNTPKLTLGPPGLWTQGLRVLELTSHRKSNRRALTCAGRSNRRSHIGGKTKPFPQRQREYPIVSLDHRLADEHKNGSRFEKLACRDHDLAGMRLCMMRCRCFLSLALAHGSKAMLVAARPHIRRMSRSTRWTHQSRL